MLRFSTWIMFHPLKILFGILLVCLTFVTPVHAAEKSILILGDSLSASYGIAVDKGWVALLQERLQTRHYDYTVFNASISGETTAGARSRLPALLERVAPDITLIELGANDGLRGFPPQVIKDNLTSMIAQLHSAGSRVILVQMHLPPNYGRAYTTRFDNLYRQIANEHGIQLAPFILQNMYDDPELMQEDGLHPRAKAQPLILNHIWPVLENLLDT
ncbi:MAG: arylesterase [Thiotrichales bacterium]|nr:arylesterase [Thiotrichales bacterium]